MKMKLLLLIISVALFLTGCNKTDNFSVLSTAIAQIDMEANGHIEQLNEYNSPETFCPGLISNFIKSSYIQCNEETGRVQQYEN